MQLSRFHSSTCAPVTARVLLRRSSSRRLLPSPQEDVDPPLAQKPSLVPTISEAVPLERQGRFRRRNVMSLVSIRRDWCFLLKNSFQRILWLCVPEWCIQHVSDLSRGPEPRFRWHKRAAVYTHLPQRGKTTKSTCLLKPVTFVRVGSEPVAVLASFWGMLKHP